jgi:hypothetical protein
MARDGYVASVLRGKIPMWRKTFLGLCAAVVVLLGLAAPASVYAKDFGSSIKIPEGDKVQLGFNGNFSIKVSGGGLRLSGTCTCLGGGGGKCDVESIVVESGQTLVCHKGQPGTSCAGRCSMITNSTTTGSGSE